MPHKYWVGSSISNIIEHIDFISQWRRWEPTNRRNTGIDRDMTEKGNKKGNTGGRIADFRSPPLGWGDFLWRVRGRKDLPLYFLLKTFCDVK